MRTAVPYMKIRQRHYEKGKLQTSISHKHGCKHTRQNITKSNPTMQINYAS